MDIIDEEIAQYKAAVEYIADNNPYFDKEEAEKTLDRLVLQLLSDEKGHSIRSGGFLVEKDEDAITGIKVWVDPLFYKDNYTPFQMVQ